jgi:hypothetical protein
MMFKTTLKTFAAAIVAVGCLTVSAEAGHKGHGHGGAKVAHGDSVKVVRGHGHHGHAHGYHHGGVAAFGLAIGGAGYSSSYGSSFGGAAWPAGKGCGGTTVYRSVAVAPVAVKTYRPAAIATVVAVPRAPVCVCD